MRYGFFTLNHHNCKRCVEPIEHLKKCKRCVEPFHLTVYFLEGSDVNESLMNEIYGIFDQQGRQTGINDVPVMFQFESLPVEDIEPLETPGFTAITFLMVFLGLFLTYLSHYHSLIFNTVTL